MQGKSFHARLHWQCSHQIWPQTSKQAATTTTSPHTSHLPCNSTIRIGSQGITIGNQRRGEIHLSSDWHSPILQQSSGFNHSCWPQFTWSSTIQTHSSHIVSCQVATWLGGNQPRWHTDIQEEWHGTSHAQQHLLPQQTLSTKSSRQPFLLLIQRQRPSWQQRHSHHIQNYQGLHVQRNRSRTRSPLHQHMGSNPCATVTQ